MKQKITREKKMEEYKNVEELNQLGINLMNAGNPKAALDYFLQAEKENPNYKETCLIQVAPVQQCIILLCIKTGKCTIWKFCMMKLQIWYIILSMREKQWGIFQQYQNKKGAMILI